MRVIQCFYGNEVIIFQLCQDDERFSEMALASSIQYYNMSAVTVDVDSKLYGVEDWEHRID